jgi:hypothetical protein
MDETYSVQNSLQNHPHRNRTVSVEHNINSDAKGRRDRKEDEETDVRLASRRSERGGSDILSCGQVTEGIHQSQMQWVMDVPSMRSL